jgi:predicted nucleic acid-binding protein
LIAFRFFLDPFRVLEIDDRIAESFAEIRAYLRRRGELVGDLDLLIAATALHHNLTLLTFNRRHFARVPGLRVWEPS